MGQNIVNNNDFICSIKGKFSLGSKINIPVNIDPEIYNMMLIIINIVIVLIIKSV